MDKWKRAYSRNVDWWFAYTELTRRILVDDGFPREKITCLDNTVDVEKLRFLYEDVSESKVRAIRDQLGIEEGSHVGIYCGSIYAEKMIDFMMRSCELVRAADDTFHLIVIGDGPGTEEMMRRWNHLAWFHWVGAKQNPQKVEYFRIADIMINPGLVGLHILDSFAFGVPLISTSWALHSPEIAYVEEGSNAILVKGNERDYAQTVVDLFRSPERLAELKTCAAKSCTERGLDGMVERFSAGILSAMRA